MEKIHYIPCGGMCNRLMTIASAAKIASSKGIKTTVYWNNNIDLSSGFYDLFKSIDYPNFEIVENKKIMYKSPSRYNYYIPRIIQQIVFFRRRFYHPQWEHYQVLDSISSKEILVESFYKIGDQVSLKDLFVPTDDIQKKIDSIVSDFSNVVGLHIRRTDHVNAIKKSTDELFIENIEKEIEKNHKVKFYVASDDQSVINKLRTLYGDRIIHPELELSRTTLNGMKDAVLDLFCLSSTKYIIGSCNSSYSTFAAQLGEVDLFLCGQL